jgi:hypothetical protein
MSAPTTHDPLVVNTRDGECWERRAVTDSGLGLYAVKGSCKCPPFKMATLAELAERGIVGSAHVLPVPVGPAPRTLDTVEDELTGVSLSLYEEELTSARLRLALESAQRGRHGRAELRGSYQFTEGSRQRWRTACIEAEQERDQLKAQVAALLAERHSTNESLDDAVQELRARPVEEPSSGGYPPALPWLALLDEDDRVEFLDELADSATVNQSSEVRLAEIERTCATWRLIAEAQHGHNTAPGLDAVTQVAESAEADPGDRLLGGEELRRAVRGHLFGGGA